MFFKIKCGLSQIFYSYTPFKIIIICLYFFNGFWKWGMLAIIWMIALIGIAIKLLWINAPRWANAAVYLAMGWLAMIGAREILTTMPPGAIVWLVLGGLVFSLGAVVYATKILNFKPGVFGYHESWHIFVIIGALCHFILILTYVAAPGFAGN